MRAIHRVVESAKCLSRHDKPAHRRSSFPRVESCFHPGWGKGSGDFSFGGQSSPRRSALNRLTQEVLRSDPSGNYRIETAVLTLIMLVSAWPIAAMIGEVIRLLR